jgi:hypothetical protein
MPPHDEHVVRILREASGPLFPSEIAEQLNGELGSGAAYTATEVVTLLHGLKEQVVQLPDGGWTLKRRRM